MPFQPPVYPKSPAPAGHHPVIIIGAGPVGLAAAVDLAQQGVPVLVLDDNDTVSHGSRAICWAKRTLEIFARLGIAEPMLRKGITWKLGRVFRGDSELYRFDLLPEEGHRMPAFVNLQQYYVEAFLVERAMALADRLTLAWGNRVTGLQPGPDRVTLQVEGPAGPQSLTAAHVLVCDGARSSIRQGMGLDFDGESFEERFLIADVVMQAEFPPERWFWFDPVFHDGRSVLLHKQPDSVWRIDLQLGPDADPEVEKRPEVVIPRIRAMLGHGDFTLDWVSVYRFQCRRMARFIHGPGDAEGVGRVIFAGDSAHLVSPFGARGGNGGIQDVDNLCWKLALVQRGEASSRLLLSYEEERIHGAEENLRNSANATRFMTPKSPVEEQFRAAVLDLAGRHRFARRFVNSGRLSTPCRLRGMALQSPGPESGMVAAGDPAPDAPLGGGGFLLDRLGGRFVLLVLGEGPRLERPGLEILALGPEADPTGLIRARYGWDVSLLIRPDQHLAAILPQGSTAEQIAAAHDRTRGLLLPSATEGLEVAA